MPCDPKTLEKILVDPCALAPISRQSGLRSWSPATLSLEERHSFGDEDPLWMIIIRRMSLVDDLFNITLSNITTLMPKSRNNGGD